MHVLDLRYSLLKFFDWLPIMADVEWNVDP